DVADLRADADRRSHCCRSVLPCTPLKHNLLQSEYVRSRACRCPRATISCAVKSGVAGTSPNGMTCWPLTGAATIEVETAIKIAATDRPRTDSVQESLIDASSENR